MQYPGVTRTGIFQLHLSEGSKRACPRQMSSFLGKLSAFLKIYSTYVGLDFVYYYKCTSFLFAVYALSNHLSPKQTYFTTRVTLIHYTRAVNLRHA